MNNVRLKLIMSDQVSEVKMQNLKLNCSRQNKNMKKML